MRRPSLKLPRGVRPIFCGPTPEQRERADLIRQTATRLRVMVRGLAAELTTTDPFSGEAGLLLLTLEPTIEIMLREARALEHMVREHDKSFARPKRKGKRLARSGHEAQK